MNKVVIVDDELIIVEGLTKTLPWEQLELQNRCNGKRWGRRTQDYRTVSSGPCFF